MKHKLKISVSKEPPNGGIVTCRNISIRERLLRFLMGNKRRVTVLIPETTSEKLRSVRPRKERAMSRMKLLLDVVSDLRSLADSIQAVCDAMASGGPMDIEKPKEEQQKTAQKVKAEKAPKITLEQYGVFWRIRAVTVIQQKSERSFKNMGLTA